VQTPSDLPKLTFKEREPFTNEAGLSLLKVKMKSLMVAITNIID
jgi:hypothetical protein